MARYLPSAYLLDSLLRVVDGWPDGLDVFSSAFADRLARHAGAFARLHLEETGRPPVACPVNEISFLAWAGGDMARMNPGARGRGPELKRQLARRHRRRPRCAGSGARCPHPGHRSGDPHRAGLWPRPGPGSRPPGSAVPGLGHAGRAGGARARRRAGTARRGGGELLLYWNNQWLCERPRLLGGQWLCEGGPLSPFDPRARPLRELLAGVHARYDRPVLLAETSIEGERRASWLRHVGAEVRGAVRTGVPVGGVCLYPVMSHPGWDDDRYCPNGLFEMEARDGWRVEHAPLAAELRRQQRLFGPPLRRLTTGSGRPPATSSACFAASTPPTTPAARACSTARRPVRSSPSASRLVASSPTPSRTAGRGPTTPPKRSSSPKPPRTSQHRTAARWQGMVTGPSGRKRHSTAAMQRRTWPKPGGPRRRFCAAAPANGAAGTALAVRAPQGRPFQGCAAWNHHRTLTPRKFRALRFPAIRWMSARASEPTPPSS